MISTHILDTTLGSPAAKVTVKLERQSTQGWEELSSKATSDDGRISFDCAPEAGIYRLTFMTEEYFKRQGQESFFQNANIAFKITQTNRKYHVPLLLNPYSYSTYRGS